MRTWTLFCNTAAWILFTEMATARSKGSAHFCCKPTQNLASYCNRLDRLGWSSKGCEAEPGEPFRQPAWRFGTRRALARHFRQKLVTTTIGRGRVNFSSTGAVAKKLWLLAGSTQCSMCCHVRSFCPGAQCELSEFCQNWLSTEGKAAAYSASLLC